MPRPRPHQPASAWYGIDTCVDPPAVAVALRTATGGSILPLAAGSGWRPDGEGCCAGLPAGRVFTVRMEAPPAVRRRLRRLGPGMLDLRLPVAVESCAVSLVVERGHPPSLLAYAMPRDVLAAELAALQRIGCPAERTVPTVAALWRRHVRESAPDSRLDVIVHATDAAWTLAIGRGQRLLAGLAVPPGDAAGTRRAAGVYAERHAAPPEPRWRVCGPAASHAAAALTAGAAAVPADTDNWLAGALALDGLMAGPEGHGNLRLEAEVHPATLRRRNRRAGLAAAGLMIAALALVASGALRLHRAGQQLRLADETLTQRAEQLAGYVLPAPGPAAVELARRELDGRLNPQVEAFAGRQLATRLSDWLRLAALRRVTFSRVALQGRRLELAGVAPSAADVSAIRDALRREGLTPAVTLGEPRQDGISFTCTAVEVEALP